MASAAAKQKDATSRAITRQRVRLAIIGLAAITLWRDIAFLSASWYPYGIDGYYYLALTEGSGWTLSGRTVPISTTVVLRALGSVLPAPVAIKVTGLACLYGTGALAFFILHRLCRSPLLSALAFFLVVKGFLRAELLVNFPKQMMGHFCVLLLVFCLFVWRPKSEWRRWLCVCGLLAAAALTHPVALGLSGMLAGSWIAIQALAYWKAPRYMAIFCGGAWIISWAAVWFAARWHSLFERWGMMVYLSTSTTPRFTLPLFYDGLSPITLYFPASFFETLLLCLALLGLGVLSWGVYGRVERAGLMRLCRAAGAFVPHVALVFCPFLVPAHLDRVGLHFRLLGSLSIAVAVVVPIVIYVFFPKRRSWIAASIIAVLALPPHAWPNSVGPPVDGGALHRAMVEVASEIPQDATIITSQAIGNMVTALWHRPRLVATRFDPPLSQANYYRLTVFEPDVKSELDIFMVGQLPGVAPRTLVGWWVLLQEETYRSFRLRLRESKPELAEKLVE